MKREVEFANSALILRYAVVFHPPSREMRLTTVGDEQTGKGGKKKKEVSGGEKGDDLINARGAIRQKQDEFLCLLLVSSCNLSPGFCQLKSHIAGKVMSEKYKKLSAVEHVLLRPEMYIGSVETSGQNAFVFSELTGKMEWKHVSVNHGLLKIIDEILLNATDNIQSSKGAQTYINVTVNPETCETTVENDGDGIPVRRHSEHKNIYVPELIFGHLLSGSNFGDTSESSAAGRHGYGAKLTNIFSNKFEALCETKGKSLRIVWRDNMSRVDEMVLGTVADGKQNRTRISFAPDLSRFGHRPSQKLSPEMFNMIRTRVITLAASFPSVTIRWNGSPALPSGSTFLNFVEMFGTSLGYGESARLQLGFAALPTAQGTKQGRRYLAVVNGIVTHSGGTHVNSVHNFLEEAIEVAAESATTEKNLIIPTSGVSRCVIPVIIMKVNNPKFDSQNKARLVSEANIVFGKVVTKERIAAGLLEQDWFLKMGESRSAADAKVANEALGSVIGSVSANERKLSKQLATRISKLVDAPRKSNAIEPKTMIVTEGDSAKALVLNSLTTHQRKYIGIFPLRGKIINVRANPTQFRKSKELLELFTAMGLKFGKVYKTTEDLRYERLVILTDQDVDGAHIRGLLLSMLEHEWPSLALKPGFINIFATPLVRVMPTGSKTLLDFFSTSDYDNWRKKESIGHKCKYYKGLGTFTTLEGKLYFEQFEKMLSPVNFSDKGRDLLNKAFAPECIQWRKEWTSKPQLALVGDSLAATSVAGKPIDVGNFINTDLWAFAAAGNRRSMPSIIDGLKPSQRKIIWAMLKRPAGQPAVKVAQLSGYIAEMSSFHHGEMALQGTIIKMAQDFTGSNNINLLVPEGQFGSRVELGNDHAAARYIYTKLSKCARLLFPAADDSVLSPIVEDGQELEPTYFVPVISTLLCNGSTGIGFGFASNIPGHHPLDVIKATRRRINGEKSKDIVADLVPWAVGYFGTMERLDEPGSFACLGHATVVQATKTMSTINIREIPFDMSTTRGKEIVGSRLDEEKIYSFSDQSGGNHVDFDLTVEDESVAWLRENGQGNLARGLGLQKIVSIRATVVHRNGEIQELGHDLAPILDQHYEARLELYKKRKLARLEALRMQRISQESVVKFVSLVLTRKIDLQKDDLAKYCASQSLPRIDDSYNYLLSKPISFFSAKNLVHQQQLLDDIIEEAKMLQKTSEFDMWLGELDLVESALRTEIADRERRVLKDHRNTSGLQPTAIKIAAPIEKLKDGTQNSQKTDSDAVGKSKAGGGGGGSLSGGMLVSAKKYVGSIVEKSVVKAAETALSRLLPRLVLL